MKVLFCGDIVGRAGRDVVIREVPRLRRELGLDFVAVNGENAAAGFGITAKICAELHEAGVDCITTGNHVWDQREIIPYIAQDKRLLRPINFPPGTPGCLASGLWRPNQALSANDTPMSPITSRTNASDTWAASAQAMPMPSKPPGNITLRCQALQSRR